MTRIGQYPYADLETFHLEGRMTFCRSVAQNERRNINARSRVFAHSLADGSPWLLGLKPPVRSGCDAVLSGGFTDGLFRPDMKFNGLPNMRLQPVEKR